nr:phosphorylase [uncultured Holophaga sp.]
MTPRKTSAPGLLLAAFPPELADLFEHPPEGWVVACAGIGLVAAAAETARLIALHQPCQVLFIGTCGAYGSTPLLGDCVSAAEVLATSLGELQGDAFRPGLERTHWRAGLELPFPGCTVANPPAITRSAEGAHLLGSVAQVEHLEAAGVFEAARAAGIPAGAVLGVANTVGPQAHEEWLAHHAAVSRRLVSLLRERSVLR